MFLCSTNGRVVSRGKSRPFQPRNLTPQDRNHTLGGGLDLASFEVRQLSQYPSTHVVLLAGPRSPDADAEFYESVAHGRQETCRLERRLYRFDPVVALGTGFASTEFDGPDGRFELVVQHHECGEDVGRRACIQAVELFPCLECAGPRNIHHACALP